MTTTYPHYLTQCAWLYPHTTTGTGANSELYDRARSCWHRRVDNIKAGKPPDCLKVPELGPVGKYMYGPPTREEWEAYRAANPIGHNGKHTNADLREAIKDHFACQCKRMTNISTADKKKLIGIIEKYNIELPELCKKERKTAAPAPGGHPFIASSMGFRYRYRFDDDGQSGIGYGTRYQDYHITKVSKCFITIEYDKRGELITQKCKAQFHAQPWRGEGAGNWYFTLDTQRIPFSQYPYHEQGDFY